jgi:hypothetical protein
VDKTNYCTWNDKKGSRNGSSNTVHGAVGGTCRKMKTGVKNILGYAGD